MMIRCESPRSAVAETLMDELSAVLTAINGDSGRASFDPADVMTADACFAVAYTIGTGAPLGCGALRKLQPGVTELKRMYSRRGGSGVGTALLRFLEQQALALGYRQFWLETRRVNQRVVDFYLASGYRPIAP